MQKLNNNENIFAQRNCLSKEELIGYAKGVLAKKEKHHVEKHLLDCELCSDALEGIMQLKDPGYLNDIHNDMIHRMSEKKVDLKKSKRTWYFAAAAVIAVFLLSGIYFQFIRNSENFKSNYANLPPAEEKIKMAEPALAAITDSSVQLNETGNQTAAPKKQTLPIEDAAQKNILRATGATSAAKDMNEMQAGVASPAPVAYNDVVSIVEEKASEGSLDDKKTTPELEKVSVDENKSIETVSGTIETTAAEAQYKNKSAAALQKQKENSPEQKQNVNDKLHDAQQNMSRENFKEALQDLNVILEQNPEEVDALYNTGLVYYKINDNANALRYFDKTLTHPDKKYFEDARWNKTLTYVQMNDKSNARKIISQIISDKSPYKKRAEVLLEELGGD